jgi:hypothetical protein
MKWRDMSLEQLPLDKHKTTSVKDGRLSLGAIRILFCE